MIEAYPLAWPAGYTRTQNPKLNVAFFQTTFGKERDALLKELKLLKATDVILTDKGVAVYFKFNGQPSVLCCDAWDLIEDNVHAIVKTVDAMRGIDRWKVSEVLQRTFTGFKALPETTATEESVWETLGLNEKPASTIIIHQAFKQQAKKVHPDVGGSSAAFQKLQDAYKIALNFFN